MPNWLGALSPGRASLIRYCPTLPGIKSGYSSRAYVRSPDGCRWFRTMNEPQSDAQSRSSYRIRNLCGAGIFAKIRRPSNWNVA